MSQEDQPKNQEEKVDDEEEVSSARCLKCGVFFIVRGKFEVGSRWPYPCPKCGGGVMITDD